jgi:hypothetical protein
MRQQRVLLALVEPMQLIDERDSAPPGFPQRFRLGHEGTDVRNARAHRRELAPRPAGSIREQAGQGRLAGAGRAPQHHGGQMTGFHHPGQRPVITDQVALAHEVVE